MGGMRLINQLAKVVSCARKWGCVIKREGAVFTTFTLLEEDITVIFDRFFIYHTFMYCLTLSKC